MRLLVAAILSFLIITLVICSIAAYRSHKPLGKTVAIMDLAIIPPVIGNLIIISSSWKTLSTVGCYIYFVGMDIFMFALLHFTVVYCKGGGGGQKVPLFLYGTLIIDAIQLLLNIPLGHAFSTEPVLVDGVEYYRLIPKAGQTFHRVVDYTIFIGILLVFILIIRNTPRISVEKYVIIFGCLVLVALLQTFYIFSRTPIDISMIGYGIFGVLIYYFSLHYRPLRLLDRMLSDIVSEMSESLFVFDVENNCIWVNEEGSNLIGSDMNNNDKLKEKLEEMFGDNYTDSESAPLNYALGYGDSIRYFQLETKNITDDKGKHSGSYLRVRDITDQKEKIKRDIYNATHDRLTGLYTQEYLYQRISETISSSKDVQYYIIYIDVKNFKVVNDIFGSDFGDYAIQCVSDLIRDKVTDRCCYGRLVGDTFGVCIPKEDFVEDKIEAVLSTFKVKRDNVEYHLLIHLGVYEVTPEDNDVSVMFDRAHLSLSLIQDEYKTHISYYDNTIRQKIIWNQSISSQLNEAIRNKDLRPYLQPIADSNGRIVGAEALARWIHPEHGFLSPGVFIPVFEKNGMIVEVDKYMWRCACEILARWRDEGRDQFISVNISPKDFYFIDVVTEITGLVKEFGIDPSRLRIEITETVMMNDSDARMELLNIFRKSGFIVEMDDFGSGYSSLSMLKDMPVDVLKIDMKFLGKTSKEEKAKTIVKNIINLSHELGISSLTEGVETQNQYLSLSEMGCELFQGYYFAKPMPVDEFDEMLSNQTA